MRSLLTFDLPWVSRPRLKDGANDYRSEFMHVALMLLVNYADFSIRDCLTLVKYQDLPEMCDTCYSFSSCIEVMKNLAVRVNVQWASAIELSESSRKCHFLLTLLLTFAAVFTTQTS